LSFTKTLQQVLGNLLQRSGIGETKAPAKAAFELRYDRLHVGTLKECLSIGQLYSSARRNFA
jgi:hypothetical protein